MTRFPVRLHVEEQPEGLWLATSPDLPDLVAEGTSLQNAIEGAEELVQMLYEAYQEHGTALPAVFRDGMPESKVLDITLLVSLAA